MKIYFIIFLMASLFACESKNASKDSSYNGGQTSVNNNIIESREKTNDAEDILSTTLLKCGNKDFKLIVVYKNENKSVNIVEDNSIFKTINLPNQSEVNGFSLNWVKKTKEGFEISIEYGSRNYYQKDFSFICEQNIFYFSKVRVKSFDKSEPEEWNTDDIEINPKLPIEMFLINDFIGND